MAGTAYQGTQLTALYQGEDDVLNLDMDATLNTIYRQWNWNILFYEGEPERFYRRMTKKFSCTFKEVKTETNAEDFYVHIVYKIIK
jgi:hypothetical protein